MLFTSEILDNALQVFGAKHQMVVAIEELGEVQHELCKILREEGLGNLIHLAEEIADAQICLEQMTMAFDLERMVESYERTKLARLAERTEQRRVASVQ